MRLERLEVRDFRGIRAATIEFGPGVTVLHGPNGLGKSMQKARFATRSIQVWRARLLSNVLAELTVVPAVVGFPIAVGLGDISDETWLLAVLLPYGFAWVFVGLRLAIRGSATLVDPPLNPTEPEVRAA